MLHDLSGMHPIEMKLALLKRFARWAYAVNRPRMSARHSRHNDDAFVLRNNLMKIKSKIQKGLG